MSVRPLLLILCCCLNLAAARAGGDEAPKRVKAPPRPGRGIGRKPGPGRVNVRGNKVGRFRITGLFAEKREAALRAAVADIPGLRLVDLDHETAEATLAYDPAELFPGYGPEQDAVHLNDLLRGASRDTLGVKPLGSLPRERWQRVDIRVAGLDCDACSLAAYEVVSRVEGVEVARASFHDGKVTAWIDPGKTDRVKVVDALKQAGVGVKAP
jgi:copper chaperone CopZ